MAFAGVIVNAKIIVGGLNLSGVSSSLALAYGAEMLDNTTFQPVGLGSNRSYQAGLKTVGITAQMFWDTIKDQTLFGRIGVAEEVVTVADVGETEGDRVFIVKGIHGTYNPASGEIGALITANLDLKSTNSPLVRAQLMTQGMKTATGNSTGINMGSAGGKRIYSALHVMSPSVAGAATVVGTVESAPTAGFAAPVVRLTHPAMDVLGADWQDASIPVEVTDTFWRSVWTITGVTPGFEIYWSFGILP
jgi:hypothetical protein